MWVVFVDFQEEMNWKVTLRWIPLPQTVMRAECPDTSKTPEIPEVPAVYGTNSASYILKMFSSTLFHHAKRSHILSSVKIPSK